MGAIDARTEKVLELIDPRQATIYRMKVADGMSVEAIAEQLDHPVYAVEGVLARVRSKLARRGVTVAGDSLPVKEEGARVQVERKRPACLSRRKPDIPDNKETLSTIEKLHAHGFSMSEAKKRLGCSGHMFKLLSHRHGLQWDKNGEASDVPSARGADDGT